MKQQLLHKEQGVKSEIERVWQDWEDKCADLEARRAQAQAQAELAEARARDLGQKSQGLKREAREAREAMEQARAELRVLQDKYEEQLAVREQEAEELRTGFRQAEERMQFEIVHLKQELEKQFKKQIAQQMASQSRLKAFKESPHPEEPGGSSFKMTLNQIASIAQNSVRQSQTPPRQYNDSMDQMGREFMRQYNQAMQESARHMTSPGGMASHAQLLDKEIQLKELQAENLQLKGVIEEMKNDMEVIVLKIQEERLQGEYKRNNSQANEQLLAMQQELISKERRIGDLERRLR